MIDGRLAIKNRTKSQGQADAVPIDTNATPEGRSRNRRVEVTLLVPAAERDRELNSVTPQTAPGAPAVSGQGKQ